MKLLEKLGPFDRKSGKLNVVIESLKIAGQRNCFVSTNLKPTVLSKDALTWRQSEKRITDSR